jgi:hypothetical protein
MHWVSLQDSSVGQAPQGIPIWEEAQLRIWYVNKLVQTLFNDVGIVTCAAIITWC